MPGSEREVSEFERRRTALAALLAEKKIDAMLVAFLPNVRYLTGYTGSSGLLVLASSGEATFFTDPRYRIAAAAEVSCRVKVSTGPILPDVMALIARKKFRKLGFEKSRLGYEQYEFLKSHAPARCVLEALPGVKLITRFVVPKPGKVKGVPETIANGPLLIEAVPLVSGVATRLESTKLL